MPRTRSATKKKAETEDVDEAQVVDSQAQQKLPVRAKEDESSKPEAPAKKTQGTLVVFDDDEDDDVNQVAAASTLSAVEKPAPKQQPQSEEEEDSSDDDAAPEAVTTQQVASAKTSASAAQKAAQEQAAAQKRKRQERDALFKKQAEERKQAEELKKAKAATAASKMDEDEEEDDSDTQLPKGSLPTTGRKRTDRIPVPNLLPQEFLTDPSSDDEENEANDDRPAKPKRRKVAAVERTLTRLDRGPRDEQLGSTVYRVTKKADDRLAPKLSKHSKSSKDVLLKRNRSAVKPRGGFFKK